MGCVITLKMVCSADGMSWDKLEGAFSLSFFLIFANSTVFFKANQEYALDKVCVPWEGGVFETQLL